LIIYEIAVRTHISSHKESETELECIEARRNKEEERAEVFDFVFIFFFSLIEVSGYPTPRPIEGGLGAKESQYMSSIGTQIPGIGTLTNTQ
jgi:hypothetical protein